MKKQTSVEWLIENINKKSWWENVAGIPEEIIEQAKATEKENMIGLLQWMNKINSETPMRLETDLDDIVEQYYNETYGGDK
jgi:hypothetical protein